MNLLEAIARFAAAQAAVKARGHAAQLVTIRSISNLKREKGRVSPCCPKGGKAGGGETRFVSAFGYQTQPNRRRGGP